MGRDFLGTYDLLADALRSAHDRVTERVRCSGLDDPKLPRLLPKAARARQIARWGYRRRKLHSTCIVAGQFYSKRIAVEVAQPALNNWSLASKFSKVVVAVNSSPVLPSSISRVITGRMQRINAPTRPRRLSRVAAVGIPTTILVPRVPIPLVLDAFEAVGVSQMPHTRREQLQGKLAKTMIHATQSIRGSGSNCPLRARRRPASCPLPPARQQKEPYRDG